MRQYDNPQQWPVLYLILEEEEVNENVAITYTKQESYKPPLRESCTLRLSLSLLVRLNKDNNRFTSYDNP